MLAWNHIRGFSWYMICLKVLARLCLIVCGLEWRLLIASLTRTRMPLLRGSGNPASTLPLQGESKDD